MSDVIQLPIQHRNHPHCEACGADLPTFNTMNIIFSPLELEKVKIEAMTFHIVCVCGAHWDLRKKVSE
jgi:hypothetical protein